ncbi:tetratricopeptide repeat protein [Novosphingobium acidiphilum]|uniref:tetratricopeptide repeat protein n=1 Tax=Novosphingobium acidiphilum TaxID=505248 RepID=UPI0005668973|nr:tetratricopeptide repeat protein [Novosphingobium acidiphilum]
MALIPKNPSNLSDRKDERRAAQEQVFLREVDDALREDDAVRLFRRYGTVIGSAILALLLALAGWMVWTNHVAQVAGTRAEAFTVALDQVASGRWDPARASLDQIAATGGPGYAAAARLVEGGAALDRKKPDDAAKIFAAVAADASAPQPYRDLAKVREVATKFDSMKPQDVIDQLKPLAVPGTPWFGSAGELVAVAQMKLGHKAEAGAMFAAMAKDTGVPSSLRGRVRQLALQLGADPGPELSSAGQPVAQ